MLGLKVVALFVISVAAAVSQEPLSHCHQIVTLDALRTPYISSMKVNHTERILCVVSNKTGDFRMISISFIPTACIDYTQDQFSSQHTLLPGKILFEIPVKRGKCVSGEQTTEPYSLILKDGIRVSGNLGFDSSFVLFFGTGIILSIVAYLVVINLISRSGVLNVDESQSIQRKKRE